jgi:hypothetical protein
MPKPLAAIKPSGLQRENRTSSFSQSARKNGSSKGDVQPCYPCIKPPPNNPATRVPSSSGRSDTTTNVGENLAEGSCTIFFAIGHSHLV